ncbi:hypothetical protein BDZ89DRAFT_1165164 [Hymenopellis radicata]|nr:hypothetical protein BDZ89DRAFT_1165164 [Hymenopellis radicata]
MSDLHLAYSASSPAHQWAPPQAVDLRTECCMFFLNEVTNKMPCISYMKIESWRLYIIEKIRPVKVVSEDYVIQQLHRFVRNTPKAHRRWNVYDPKAGPDASCKIKFRKTPPAACMWRSWLSDEIVTNEEFKSRVDGCYRAAINSYEVGWQRDVCCCDFVHRVANRITPYIPTEWNDAISAHASVILGTQASLALQQVDEYLRSYTTLLSIPRPEDMPWLQYFGGRSRNTVPVHASFLNNVGLRCGEDLLNVVLESSLQQCYEDTLSDYPAVSEEAERARRAEWEEAQRREQARREAEVREAQRREQARRDVEREEALRGYMAGTSTVYRRPVYYGAGRRQ